MKVLQEILISQESVNDDKVVVLDLYFKNGDIVKCGDIALEIETSKATLTLEVLQGGYIFYDCTEGDEVAVGSIVAKVYDENILTEKPNILTEDILVGSGIIPSLTTIYSKEAKLLLIEKGLSELDFINKDFVNVDDIYSQINRNANKIINKLSTTTIQVQSNISNRNVHVDKISTQKKREIDYLSAVQSYGLNSSVSIYVEVETFLNFAECNMSLLKGSVLPIITYELARLLEKYPKINSYFEEDSIVYYNDVNIGIAIDMEKGLKVLKIPNTNQLNIIQIERAILDLSRKYYENKTTVTDASDITFTISDLSNSGISSFSPLINKNNSAILAISAVDEISKRINLNLTFDHRVTEGKYTASFLYELKTRIESYFEEAIQEEKIGSSAIRCYKCRRKLKDNLYDNVTFFKVIDSNGKDQILCSICYSCF